MSDVKMDGCFLSIARVYDALDVWSWWQVKSLKDGLALFTSTCPHDVGEHLLIDLNALRVLSTGQLPFSPGIHIKLSFPVVDPALSVCVVNGLGVYGAFNVTFDSLDGLEDEVGGKICELLDAAVSNSCGVGVSSVSEETYFDDGEMPAKTGVGLIFTPDMLKNPFELCLVPSVGDAEGDESCG